jgi:hypothetical protein
VTDVAAASEASDPAGSGVRFALARQRLKVLVVRL